MEDEVDMYAYSPDEIRIESILTSLCSTQYGAQMNERQLVLKAIRINEQFNELTKEK